MSAVRVRRLALASVPMVLALALPACGGARRFPVRAPLATDTDLVPRNVACREKPKDDDPHHVSCAPEEYVSPFAWDAADNTIFRPLAKLFAVDPPRNARNVDAFDEVLDSAWFTNRHGRRRMPREELLRGACSAEDLLQPEKAEPGSWKIDQGKPNGASKGFRIRVGKDKKKYMLKTDVKVQPERPTAASVIGAALYHAVGFHTSCEQIVYFDRKLLTLSPGLTYTANDGVTLPFDATALATVFDEAAPAKQGNLDRFQASAWLPGHLIGPFQYEGTRDDDPNDVIPHEDRRELRGGRVLASWIHHFDAREQNSMDSWIAADPSRPDSSPGHVRHYYLDTSDALGSEWAYDGISRRLGHSYVLDFKDVGADFLTLGLVERPWERNIRTPGMEMFGYFHFKDFEPDNWVNEYPNPAFSRALERDNAWMARILSRFDTDEIHDIVALGKFSKPGATEHITYMLEMRLRLILERYLTRLSPLADLRSTPNAICATDLARRRNVGAPSRYVYTAEARGAGGARRLTVSTGAEGEVCVDLPHVAPDGGPPDDASARYVVVRVTNGLAEGPLDAHVVDLGPKRGFKVVGLERPDP